ncbi:quinol dehydrogenase ferredoxin subunit NapH [Malikia sp.]|uniref:quinol dehydrogenase ferredoxin subunit NapH n=1 Tax=Malikia sp. TaxID=2070706 RepID=UPI0026214D8D|nr:quinol dehydrogenase ferredoxin subunit NapH [Malikia sp.]MDD2730209.1 quinol dehydrogenase ferredoxin subunit NapH [Malikia sp.]
MSQADKIVGREAIESKGWWRAHRWLLLRRLSQLGIIGLFLLGPLAGIWIVKGNLSSSMTLEVLPLTDPFTLAQVIAARHWPELSALVGAAIAIAFYALVGGRVFCSWVCPVNVATDAASWLRRSLKITTGRGPRELRYWLIPAILAACAVSGVTVWEWVNPVSLTQRALIFGGSTAFGALAAVFIFDLLVAPRGWCGHLCPVGATYALIGSKSLLRVSAQHSSRCNDCADCYAVCPEPQIIPIALKGKGGASPVIDSSACTNCGRCIDVCGPDVFTYTHRFNHERK